MQSIFNPDNVNKRYKTQLCYSSNIFSQHVRFNFDGTSHYSINISSACFFFLKKNMIYKRMISPINYNEMNYRDNTWKTKID